MITRLENNIILYHGSTDIVEKIDLKKCRVGKDFGLGFYLTTSKKQAENFAKIVYARAKIKYNNKNLRKVVNKYKLLLDEKINIKYFDGANIEWLHYVVSNRERSLFNKKSEKYKKYDVIAGKIANDQTNETITLYMNGGYGVPGTKNADETAIRLLLPNKLENQYCFKNEKVINKLFYEGDEIIK